MIELWKKGYKTFKIDHNNLWLLVYDFKPKYGKFTLDEALFSLNKNKFSLISFLGHDNMIYRYNSSYEFLLEYPDDFPGQYNWWIQSKNPLEDIETENSVTATGYAPIEISWNVHSWGGLMKSIHPFSVLDGQIGTSYWNFAIGDCDNYYPDSTPGPGVIVYHSLLWIRVNAGKYFKRTRQCRITKPFHLFDLFVCVILIK